METPEQIARHPHHVARDSGRTPLNVYWEMTQACALACRHCRAGAIPERHPLELTHEESLRFIRQLAGFGDPLPQLVLTGGDPRERGPGGRAEADVRDRALRQTFPGLSFLRSAPLADQMNGVAAADPATGRADPTVRLPATNEV